MKAKLNKVQVLILNSWSAYLIIVSVLFFNDSWHWQLEITNLINYSLWFLVFLLTFAIYRTAQYNRYIFLNISLLALVYALSFFHTLVGSDFLFGSDFLMYYIQTYRKFLISLLTCISVVYITIDYLFYSERAIYKYLWTLGIAVPFCFYFYYRFLIDPNYVFTHNNELIFNNVETNALALFFIILYSILVYLKEKPISRYVDAIVVLLFFFIMYDGFDSWVFYFKIDYPLPISSELLLTLILLLFLWLFYIILRNIFSEFGQFYDRLIFEETNINLKIIKKSGIFRTLFFRFQDYLRIFPNRFFFTLLVIIGLTLFITLVPVSYGKRIILFLVMAFIIFLIYYYILMRKNKGDKHFFN